MAKKKKIKREVNADNKFEKDTVVFMTAYDIHKIKRHFFRFRKKANPAIKLICNVING